MVYRGLLALSRNAKSLVERHRGYIQAEEAKKQQEIDNKASRAQIRKANKALKDRLLQENRQVRAAAKLQRMKENRLKNLAKRRAAAAKKQHQPKPKPKPKPASKHKPRPKPVAGRNGSGNNSGGADASLPPPLSTSRSGRTINTLGRYR
ncbi:hypothetical protein CC86DRAFT_423545 [Ophiobolus disseminans]|uniref:Uncharacterized protein n=1 Tax=Ophiobolus disseminans TaxID=1469910 RepID=A0A6A6ZND7_9PLEO|nr:hypothetical protein CC86DRAFT_423545 [Ophiobolus disseminans]